jgi:hypothetical protein
MSFPLKREPMLNRRRTLSMDSRGGAEPFAGMTSL